MWFWYTLLFALSCFAIILTTKKVFYHFAIFGFKNAKKNQLFEEIKRINYSFFIELKNRSLQICLTDLTKNTPNT